MVHNKGDDENYALIESFVYDSSPDEVKSSVNDKDSECEDMSDQETKCSKGHKLQFGHILSIFNNKL